MKAIITKYLPFTNTKPSRIKASAEGVKSIIRTCDGLEGFGRSVHIQAAHLFCADNNWSGNLASGGLPSGEWAHCFIPTESQAVKNLASLGAWIESQDEPSPGAQERYIESCNQLIK